MRINSKRIGFFAGAFDPIHDGHVEVAKSAIRELELDILYLMIEKKPWGDKNPTDFKHRCSMVELALKNEPNISQLEMPDNIFTISKTLKYIEQKFPSEELYFILGADVFMNMNAQQWPSLDDLLKHYIVVFERGNILESDISNHAIDVGVVIAIFPSPHPFHSSTDVRLKLHDKSLWLPKSVADYIDETSLYKDSDSMSV